jgi:hypothetical protein
MVKTYVIWLSEFCWSVSELAELLERTFSSVKEMFAHLSLEFLLQGVELTLVAVEIVVVGLLGQVSKDFTWWVVKVSWSSLGINTLSLISGFLFGR